jgi:hypothetical protein
MLRAYNICYVRNMALFAWGLDEIAETIGLLYAIIVGLLIALVAMERNLDAEPMPQMQLVRRLSRQWLDRDAEIDPRPVQVWLSRTHTRDADKLSRKLQLSHEETVNLLNLAGYQNNQVGQRGRPKG